MGKKQALQEDISDETLCRLAASGNREAEETLVLRYTRLVRICARLYYLTGGDSEDLIQEGMLGLLAAIREYRPDRAASFHTFAEICIKSRLLSAVKAATRGKHAPLNHYVSFEPSLFDRETNRTYHRSLENPEDLLISREEVQERIEKLKRELSVFETQVLDLYLNGLSYTEIAAKVEKPPKSVDNAVQRIRHKVEQQLSFGGISRR